MTRRRWGDLAAAPSRGININGGVALFPLPLLFAKFFVVVTVVIGFIADVPDPGVMQRPPRKPGARIVSWPQVIRWFVTGFERARRETVRYHGGLYASAALIRPAARSQCSWPISAAPPAAICPGLSASG